MENLFLEDFIKYKFLSNIKFSPNGQSTGFLVYKIDMDNNKYISDIYYYNPIYSNPKKLTDLTTVNFFVWLDKNTIMFSCVNIEEDSTVFYKINIDKKQEERLFKLPLNISNFKIIDSNNILIQSRSSLNKSNKENLDSNIGDVTILDEIPFWSDEHGFTNKVRNRLYIYKIKDNTFKSINDEFTSVNSFELNSDKSLFIITTNSFIDKRRPKDQLQLYDIKKDKLIKISPDNEFNYSYANFFQDKICFIANSMATYGINENPHFYITVYQGQEMTRISHDNFDFGIGNTIGSDCRYGNSNSIVLDGEYIYFSTTEGDSSFINRIDIDGNIEKLTNKKGSIDSFDVYNAHVHFTGLRSLRLQELYSLDNKIEKQISFLNEWVMKDKTLSIPEKLTFKT